MSLGEFGFAPWVTPRGGAVQAAEILLKGAFQQFEAELCLILGANPHGDGETPGPLIFGVSSRYSEERFHVGGV